MFFKKFVDKKKDKVEFDIKPNTCEIYISVTFGCIRFIDSYRFSSCSLDAIIITLVDNSHKSMKDLTEKLVDNDEMLKIVIDIVEENKTIRDLIKDYPDKIKKLEEALLTYMGEIDPRNLKTGFPDKWKALNKKLTYPYEYFEYYRGISKTC